MKSTLSNCQRFITFEPESPVERRVLESIKKELEKQNAIFGSVSVNGFLVSLNFFTLVKESINKIKSNE